MNTLTTIAQGSSYGDVRATLNSVLGRTFDPKLYGAIGDGVANDTAAINAAVSALNSAGRGRLFFPPGIYVYTDPRFKITASNAVIEGPGAEVRFTSQDPSYFGRILFDGGVSSGTITNVGIRGAGFTARDVSTADGDNPVPATGDGQPYASSCNIVCFRGCADFFIDGGTYAGSRQWTINVIRSTGGRIVGATIKDAFADGVHIHSDSHHILVGYNDFYNCADDNIAVGFNGAACSDIMILSNRIHETGSGIAVYGAETGKTDRISIITNTLYLTYGLGIKVAPACYSGNNSSPYKSASVGNVISRGNTLVAIGMRTTGQNRGGGTVYPINPLNYGGTVDTFISEGDRVDASRNNAVRCEAGGVVTNLIIRDLSVGVMAAFGANVNSPTGGGFSSAPPDNNQADIVPANSTNVIIRGCTKGGTLIADVPASGTTSSGTTGTTTQIADNFNRADVSPAVGALGATSTGNVTWTGDAAGISSQKAYLATGGYKQQQVAIAQSDCSVTADVTIVSANDAASVFFGTSNGSQILLSTQGGFYYYDNSNGNVSNISGSGFTALGAGTYTLKMTRSGNTVTGYINGNQIGSSSPGTMPASTTAGFQDRGGAGGTARYDNFSVSTVA